MTMSAEAITTLPIAFDDVCQARQRLAPHLTPTPFRRHPLLDEATGLRLLVKHENHQPTGSFKIRNGLSLMTALLPDERARGVVAASTGNHGQGIAYGAALVGAQATICVPRGNNPEKNAAMRAWGATVVEEGRDYDESVQAMMRIAKNEGRVVAHSTNDPRIIAGAGTMTLEILEQAKDEGLDALVLAIGGGSQAVGALTVAKHLAPNLEVYGVQAAGAPAQYDAWCARSPRTTEHAHTFAEGVATRTTYELTFPALLEGLSDFITLTEAEIAEGVRMILATTHNVVEGAGAMGVMGARKLRDRLTGKRVAVVFCGGNLDSAVLRRILNEGPGPNPSPSSVN
jgi:threonine dehydratase